MTKSIIKKETFATLTDLNIWLTEERKEQIEIIAFYPSVIHNVYKPITIFYRFVL